MLILIIAIALAILLAPYLLSMLGVTAVLAIGVAVLVAIVPVVWRALSAIERVIGAVFDWTPLGRWLNARAARTFRME